MITMAGHSAETITAFVNHYRQLISSSLDPEDTVIGGEDVIVELDESKFGKRKYNRGHPVGGSWVFGGIERTPERRVFLSVVPDRSAETLLTLIERHVLPGSIVYSDMWAAHNGIEDQLALRHMTVNHSVSFVDPDTGVHTNTIEGLWNGIKLRVPPRNRGQDSINGQLMEFIWRKKNEHRLWEGLMEAFASIHYA